MAAISPGPVVNLLIEGLPHKDRRLLLALCEPVTVNFGSVLCEPDEPFHHVLFPLTGFISLVTMVEGHKPLEVGLIGNEGMLGATMALGIDAVPLRALVQGSGTALRMKATQFRQILLESAPLSKMLDRYLYVLLAQLSQISACTRFHDLDQRLARWLLMTHDRAHADHFHLTHEFLAGMLGVRRSGISNAASAMQDRGLIHYSRGDIEIIDRKGLEALSCECYQSVIEDYRQRMG